MSEPTSEKMPKSVEVPTPEGIQKIGHPRFPEKKPRVPLGEEAAYFPLEDKAQWEADIEEKVIGFRGAPAARNQLNEAIGRYSAELRRARTAEEKLEAGHKFADRVEEIRSGLNQAGKEKVNQLIGSPEEEGTLLWERRKRLQETAEQTPTLRRETRRRGRGERREPERSFEELRETLERAQERVESDPSDAAKRELADLEKEMNTRTAGLHNLLEVLGKKLEEKGSQAINRDELAEAKREATKLIKKDKEAGKSMRERVLAFERDVATRAREEREAEVVMSDYYLQDLKRQTEMARSGKSEELLNNVRAQIEAELWANASPFLGEITPREQRRETLRQDLQEIQSQLDAAAAGERILSDEQREELERQRVEREQEIQRLEEEIGENRRRAERFTRPLEQHRDREEEILETDPDLFLREEIIPGFQGVRVERGDDGSVTVTAEFEEMARVARGFKPIHFTFKNIEEAQAELRNFLNAAVRGYEALRGVHHITGRLIVEAMRVFTNETLKRRIEPEGREKIIHMYEEAEWEYDTIKRILDYWLIACDGEQGMGKEFKQGVHYGRRLSDKHLKWLWTSYRGKGVLKAMGESMPELNVTDLKTELMAFTRRTPSGRYGTENDDDVNRILGAMLRLGGGMGVFDGAKKYKIRLPGREGVIFIEANPNLPWAGAMGQTEGTSEFLYEVMKNTYAYYWKYPDSRHELISLFLEDTGRYTEKGEPIYRCWLSNELLYFITAFQQKGLAKFYFDNIRGYEEQPDGQLRCLDDGSGSLAIERRKELGWDETKTDEENLKALAMFNERELLAEVEAENWETGIKRADGQDVWDQSLTNAQNLENLRNLPIDQLTKLPSAYWLIRKNLVNMKAWKIDNWHEFRFDKFEPGNLYGAWCQNQDYMQATRNDIIGILRAQPETGGIMGWIDKLETQHMTQIPEEFAYLKHNFLDFIKDSLSYISILPHFYDRRMAGDYIAVDLRNALAGRQILEGWRKKVRIAACGGRGYSYRNPSAFPDWLLGRQVLQFISERRVLEPYLRQNRVSYEEFYKWCRLNIKGEPHPARSFDGDQYFWNEFEEMGREEWQRWLATNQVAAAQIERMIRELPSAVYWKRNEPAFEYMIEDNIIKTYARSVISAQLRRRGLAGLFLSFVYNLGFPLRQYEENILAMRVLRRQCCGMDLRTEEERMPLLEDGTRPFKDELVGRYWLPQKIGLRDEILPDGTVRQRWVPIHESRHTPRMFDRLSPGLLLDYDLLPPIPEIQRINQIADETTRNQQLRDLLRRTARERTGREATEELLDELEQLSKIVLIEDSIEARKRRTELMYQEARRKMGLDEVKHLIYMTQEGCPQSEEEFSPQRPFHLTEGWFEREFTRRGPKLYYQHVINEVAWREVDHYLDTGERRRETVDDYAEKYQVQKRLYNPLTIWLVLKATRNAGVIDENEFTKLCDKFNVNIWIAALYYQQLAALGFEHDIRRELVAKIEDPIGTASMAAITELTGFAKTNGKLNWLIGGRVRADMARVARNIGVPTVIAAAWPHILWLAGGPAISTLLYQIEMAAVSGLSTLFAYEAKDRGGNVAGRKRFFGILLGLMGDRLRRSSFKNLSRGYCGLNLWGLLTWGFGNNPIDLPLNAGTHINIDEVVRTFAASKKELGGGLARRH